VSENDKTFDKAAWKAELESVKLALKESKEKLKRVNRKTLTKADLAQFDREMAEIDLRVTKLEKSVANH
jgi:hypothetical protein